MIAPYKKPRPRPELAWLLDAKHCLTEAHDTIPLKQCKAQIWGDIELIMDLLRQGIGEALCWDNRPIRWSPQNGTNSWPVRVLQVPVPAKPEIALEGLCDWRDWLCSYGAAPAGSLASSGMSLLKARLEKPLWTRMGEPPPIRFTLGGRQELGPHGSPAVFEGELRQWDIQAAYARTLGHLRYGGWWAKVAGNYRFDLNASNEVMIFVRAKVRIPEQEWAPLLGPLPERPRQERDFFLAQFFPIFFPTSQDLQGTWTWQELAQAETSGCRILRILEGWIHCAQIEQRPFLAWWRAVERGRQLDGFAGLLAKATGNATWGQFAIRRDGRRSLLSVVRTNGKLKRVIKPLRLAGGGNPSQRAPDLAEFVTGLVRAELYRGMMIAGEQLVSAHTDGLWLHGDRKIPGWRSKERATRLRLVTPQDLAYRCPGEKQDRYVVSGIRAHKARAFFEQQWENLERERAERPLAMRERDRAARPIPIVRR